MTLTKVTADLIASESITASKMAADAVETAKIKDAAVTQEKVGSGVSGTGPAFSAYQSSAQTLSSATIEKLQFQAEEFDTSACFNSTTNYRFTPTVAGYYFFNGSMAISSSATTGFVSFYKNGSEAKRGTYNSASGGVNTIEGTALIYCNGTTDYVELWGYLGTGQALSASSVYTYFQGFMVRAA